MGLQIVKWKILMLGNADQCMLRSITWVCESDPRRQLHKNTVLPFHTFQLVNKMLHNQTSSLLHSLIWQVAVFTIH